MIFIFVAMFCYAIAIIFGAAAARHANTNLAAAVTNIVSAIVPIMVAVPLLSKRTISSQRFGILMALLAGVMVAFFVMALNKSYDLNKVGIVTPIVFGGAIFLSTLMSYFIFKEKIGQLQFIGLVVLAIGFSIVTYARAIER